jgi:hypothetical protein
MDVSCFANAPSHASHFHRYTSRDINIQTVHPAHEPKFMSFTLVYWHLYHIYHNIRSRLATFMATHAAVITASPRAPLEIRQVPSPRPLGNEVRVRNEWTTSGPLDLHQADGWLLVTSPQTLGGGVSGTVVELGDEVKNLKIGDKVRSSLIYFFPDRS